MWRHQSEHQEESSKKLSRAAIPNSFKKNLLLWLFWLFFVNMQILCAFVFTVLFEGWEIDRRSKFFASRHLKSIGWIFLNSYHSTCSFRDLIKLFNVHRLMSQMIDQIQFLSPTVIILKRKWDINVSKILKLKIFYTDFENIDCGTNRSSRKFR